MPQDACRSARANDIIAHNCCPNSQRSTAPRGEHMNAAEDDIQNVSQGNLSSLPQYRQQVFTDFESVGPDTDLASLNLSWREADLPERARTKHVHRLHPYLGKFVPQLAEIFLRKYRPRTGDLFRVCDPFMGSGTTLVEANVQGIAAFGCDISAFNCLMAEVKTAAYDFALLERELTDILAKTVRSAGSVGAQAHPGDYLTAWYLPESWQTLLAYRSLIPEYYYQRVMQLILSRSGRSARLATHDNLDAPRQPQREPYFCHKHRRICQPTSNAAGFLKRYTTDTIARLREFARVRTDAEICVLHGDARRMALPEVDLVLTSPPYVGLIDYHQQHRYAYELLGLPRFDESEIGAAAKGSSKRAQQQYRSDVICVLAAAARCLRPDGVMVIVIGDRHGLYEDMAIELGLREELRLRRHVNRRTGRRPGEFFEDILIWRAQ